MVERSTIVNPFFRDLYDELVPEIDKRMIQLAAGSAKQIQGSVVTTAESYAEQVATISAYNEVLKICEKLEQNIHGNRPETDVTQE